MCLERRSSELCCQSKQLPVVGFSYSDILHVKHAPFFQVTIFDFIVRRAKGARQVSAIRLSTPRVKRVNSYLNYRLLLDAFVPNG